MKDVFTIVEKEGWDKGVWRKIGTAFENRDGSLTLFLDALPVNGKLHIRDRKTRQESPPKDHPEVNGGAGQRGLRADQA